MLVCSLLARPAAAHLLLSVLLPARAAVQGALEAEALASGV